MPALPAPTAQNVTVPEHPRLRLVEPPPSKGRKRRSNSEMGRVREYLTPAEVELLMATARKRGRHGHRDATVILLAYRHGLRVAELCALTWDQIDFDQGDLHVKRLKGGKPSTHPIAATSCGRCAGCGANGRKGVLSSRPSSRDR